MTLARDHQLETDRFTPLNRQKGTESDPIETNVHFRIENLLIKYAKIRQYTLGLLNTVTTYVNPNSADHLM